MNLSLCFSCLDAWGFSVARFLLCVLWQSSLVFAATLLISRMLRRRRPSVRHALWVGALLLAPLLPFLTSGAQHAGAPQASFSVLPAYSQPSADFAGFPEAASMQSFDAPSQSESTSPPPRPAIVNPLDYPWALGLLVYLLGATLFLTWFGMGRRQIRRWLRSSLACTDARVLSLFPQAYPVFESVRVPVPVSVGVLHPRILLPQNLAARLTDEELHAVALHEAAHLKRHDPLILTLVSLVRALLFFHPLVWLAARQVSTLAEHCADDAVLDATREPLPYAQMLARLSEELPTRSLSTEMATGLLFTKSAFLARVEAVLSDRTRIRRLSRWALAGTMIGIAASLAVALSLPLGETSKSAPILASTELPSADYQSLIGRHNALVAKLDGAFQHDDAIGQLHREFIKLFDTTIYPQMDAAYEAQIRIVEVYSASPEPPWTDDDEKRIWGELSEPCCSTFGDLFHRIDSLLAAGALDISATDAATARKMYHLLIEHVTPSLSLQNRPVIFFRHRFDGDLRVRERGYGLNRMCATYIIPILSFVPSNLRNDRQELEALVDKLKIVTPPETEPPAPYKPPAVRHYDSQVAKLDTRDRWYWDVRYSLDRLGKRRIGDGSAQMQSPRPEPAPTPRGRVLPFPKDRSIGKVWIIDSTSPVSWKLDWKEFAQAQGDVEIPPGKLVQLQVSEKAGGDLSPLANLRASDIDVLSLYGAAVGDEDLTTVKRFSGLKGLALIYTSATGLGLAHVADLKQLGELELNGSSNLTDDSLSHLSQLASLHFLGLGFTGIGDAGLEHLKPLTHLTDLDLRSCAVTDKGLETLTDLKALEELWLDDTRISDAGLRPLGKLEKLTVLGLSGDAITDAGLSYLIDMKNLENISAFHTRITDAGMIYLQGLPRLRGAFICNIGDEGVAHLSGLPALTHLGIDNATFTAASISSFKKMRALRWVGFSSDSKNEVLLAALRRALPDCEVEYHRQGTLGELRDRLDQMLARVGGAVKTWTAPPNGGSEVTPAPTPQGRVLHFPADRSLGTVLIPDGTRSPSESLKWKVFAEARGDVEVPPGRSVRLAVIGGGADLSPLRNLAFGDLQSVQIGNAPVTDHDVFCIAQIPELPELTFGCWNQGPDGLAHLSKMRSLRTLEFSDITGEGIAALPAVPSLRELKIRRKGPDFTPTQMEGIARQSGLLSLWLTAGLTGDECIARLTRLTSLKQFRYGQPFLGGGKGLEVLTDRTLAALGEISTLESIALYDGNYTSDGLAHLARLPNLRVLEMPNNSGFTDAGLAHIAKMKRLESLYLRGNGLSNRALDELSAALPGCKIRLLDRGY